MRIFRGLFVYGACLASLASGTGIVSAQTPILPVLDHIHLNVPDQAKGVEWYQKILRRPADDGGARIA